VRGRGRKVRKVRKGQKGPRGVFSASPYTRADQWLFAARSVSVGRAAAFLVSSIFMTAASAASVPEVGWSAYGGDAGGTR